jgi:hypothetical protein
MERCTACGSVTMAEDVVQALQSMDPEDVPPGVQAGEDTAETEEVDAARAAELAFLTAPLETEDVPTEWSELEPSTQVMDDITVTSEDAPTSVLSGGDLPFHLESQPPPPRRAQGPNTGDFLAPPMIFSIDDATENAPADPLGGGDDLFSLSEALAPPVPPEPLVSEQGPGPESDFDEERTRPAYPMSMETTLDPAVEIEPFRAERERRRQTRTYLAVSTLAVVIILAVGSQVLRSVDSADDQRPALSLSDAIGFLGIKADVDVSTAEAPADGSDTPDERTERTEPAEIEPEQVAVAPAPTMAAPASSGPAPTTIRVTRGPEPSGDGSASTAPPQKIVVSVAPSAPAPADFDELVRQGWSTVDGDPAAAQVLFENALRQRIGHPEASFGLGLALWRQGRKAGAVQHLCVAMRRGQEDTRREIEGMLRSEGLSCP